MPAESGSSLTIAIVVWLWFLFCGLSLASVPAHIPAFAAHGWKGFKRNGQRGRLRKHMTQPGQNGKILEEAEECMVRVAEPHT